jgi:hypothetical protein
MSGRLRTTCDVGVSVGGAEHSLAGPFRTKAAACDWIERQTTIGQAAAIP